MFTKQKQLGKQNQDFYELVRCGNNFVFLFLQITKQTFVETLHTKSRFLIAKLHIYFSVRHLFHSLLLFYVPSNKFKRSLQGEQF